MTAEIPWVPIGAEYLGYQENYWPTEGYKGGGQPPKKTGHVFIVKGNIYIFDTKENTWYKFIPAEPDKIIKGKCTKQPEYQQVGSDVELVGFIEDCQPDQKIQGAPEFWKDATDDPLVNAPKFSGNKNICDIILVEAIKSYLL